MRKGILAILILISVGACGQRKINIALKKQLDSVMVLDQNTEIHCHC